MLQLKKIGRNKKADLLFPIIIFVVLNIMFFTIMLLFVQRVSSNALVYEESYAKQIALILNRAESGMQFEIDVSDLIKTAIKNDVNTSFLNETIQINAEEGIVFVKARKEGGFEQPFFSKIKINSGINPTTRINIELENQQVKGGKFFIVIE